MSLTPFDKRLLAEGLAFFDRPRLASLLEQLGGTYTERVDTLATMLRHCSAEELEEMVDVFERALTRATRARVRNRDEERAAGARERDRDDGRTAGDGDASDESRRRRYSASAERREQRRRAS